MAKKPPSNPLFAAGGGSANFSVADSFGITASLPPAPPTVSNAEEDSFIGGGGGGGALPVPPLSAGTPATPSAGMPTPSMFTSPMAFFKSPAPDKDPFSELSSAAAATGQAGTSPQSVSLVCPNTPASPPAQLQTPMPPPSLSVQAPSPLAMTPGVPPPGQTLFVPPPVATVAPMTSSSSIKRPTYAPTPFLGGNNAPASPAPSPGSLANIPGLPPLPEPKTIQHVVTTPSYTPSPLQQQLPPSQSAPNLASASQQSSSSYPSSLQTFGVPAGEVTSHWFFRQRGDTEVWKPFSVEDSMAIDMADVEGKRSEPVAVEGTRYDVYIDRRVKVPVYWTGKQMEIRKCSWFRRRDPEGRWIPYDEANAAKLETAYQDAAQSGRWQVKVIFDSGEWVMLHSPEVMMHFPTSSTSHGALDDWGQVQPQTDPSLRPQVVHRGLDGLPDIPDGESETVDHVFFVVHGIGAACDIKFRPLEDVVDGFRDLTADMSEKHFAGARLASKVNRAEFLPVQWHDKLHGENTGTDARIQPLTLRSIPKLRAFVNDTLLDVLFYTSPLYCQTILDTVAGEINRIHRLFSQRNPGFQGECSVIGHSLGSLILFDLLSGQKAETEEVKVKEDCLDTSNSSGQDLEMPRWEKDLSIEDVFSKLEISEHLPVFTGQGIGIAELETCSEDDLKEAGLPLGPRKRLLSYLNGRTKRKSGFDEFQASSVAKKVSYNFGPAGTGQPSVKYPSLNIKPVGFFALGSPIGMFLAVRGIESLGADFSFPTCKMFFNIFHPYDPVAYRIESLVDKDLAELRPYLVPHHMGRKRMHLEIKETMSRVGQDIKQKVMDSLKATLGAVYSVAGSITGQVEEAVESELASSVRQEPGDNSRSESPVQETVLECQLNSGRRIDYVLQEAPLESFNEYVFAVTSHLCYWESEDTALMIIKEIYSSMQVFADNELPQNKLYNPSVTGGALYPHQSESYGMARTGSVPANLDTAAPGHYQPPPVQLSSPGQSAFTVTGQGQQSPPYVPANAGPSIPPVTPSFFNVHSMTTEVPSPPKPGVSSAYPRPMPSLGQQQPQTPVVMGMDPTAPIVSDRPIGPPPIGGFKR